jgi:hypothetical protein
VANYPLKKKYVKTGHVVENINTLTSTLTSYLLPLTSYLLPLTSYLLPLTPHILTRRRRTSHVSRLTSHITLLTSHLSPHLTSHTNSTFSLSPSLSSHILNWQYCQFQIISVWSNFVLLCLAHPHVSITNKRKQIKENK